MPVVNVKVRFFGADNATSWNGMIQLQGPPSNLENLFRGLLADGVDRGRDMEIVAKGMCGLNVLPRHYMVLVRGHPVGPEDMQLPLADGDEVIIIPMVTGG
jgi:hypothetical protein